jgi:hypothetical protein
MALPYELNQLLDERNQTLYQQVAGRLNVRLEPSDDSGWGCKQENHDGIIYCSKSNCPIACFTHELLHLKFESNGMGRPYHKTDNSEFPTDAIGFFHNQLVHHKIYPPFIALGFKSQEFLNDDDAKGMTRILKRDLSTFESLYKKGRKPLTGLMIAMPFFSINSPHDQNDTIKKFEQRLKAIANPNDLSDLEKILRDWKQSENPNCSRPLACIFKVAGYPRVGFSVTGTDYDIIYAGNVTI